MAIDGETNKKNLVLPPRDAVAPENSSVSLHIGIVGAGIAGLMAAVALRESGHNVELFEKSSFSSEVGAAVMAPPNSARVLSFYGFDFDRAQATASENTIYYADPTDLNKKRVEPSHNYREYHAPWYLFHRVDLHNELKRMATETNTTRPGTGLLHLVSGVSEIDQDGTIHFQDGTKVKKDLIIAADGIRSSFLPTIMEQDDIPTAQPYMSMLRLMIPAEKINMDAETQSLFEDGFNSLRVLYGYQNSVIMYGCRSGTLQNIGIIYSPSESQDEKGNDISSNEGFVKKITQEYGKSIQSICSQAQGVGQWKLFTRKPLDRFSCGKVVIIGDAAHPMPPLRAQGASMAIEDAAALGVLLSKLGSEAEIPGRLELYDQLRVNRVAATQIISSQHHWNPDDVPAKYIRYFDGTVPQNGDDLERFSCASNVIQDALDALKNDV